MPVLQLQVKKENDKDWSILARREYFGENEKQKMTTQLEEARDGWQRNTDMYVGSQFQIVPEAKQPKPRAQSPVVETPAPAPVVHQEIAFTGVKSPRKPVARKAVKKFHQRVVENMKSGSTLTAALLKASKKSKGRKS